MVGKTKVFGGAFALLALLTLSGIARADDWGCQVLLCLANPAGPEGTPTCVPPIERLWAALRKNPPDPFPTCTMASGPAGRSWAQPIYNWYSPCPAGTSALASGALAVQGTSTFQQSPWYGNNAFEGQVYAGIGNGQDVTPTVDDPLSAKVCVSGYVGDETITQGAGDGAQEETVSVYRQVTTLAPNRTPNAIDVFINNALYRQVRY